MSCAKAGPHWRADLPLTTSPAVELLPYYDGGGEPAVPGPSQRHLQPFSLHDVSLVEGTHVSRATATNLRYLLSLPVDSLLYAWRRNAGLPQPAGATPLRGWESPGSELRGHISWFKMRLDLCVYSAPLAQLPLPGAQGPPTQPRAPLQQLGSLVGYHEALVVARSKRGFSISNQQARWPSRRRARSAPRTSSRPRPQTTRTRCAASARRPSSTTTLVRPS